MESPMKYSILICLTQSIPIAKKERNKNENVSDKYKSIKECENLVIEFK